MASADSPSTLRDDLNALLALQTVDTRIDRAKATLAGLDTGAVAAAQYRTQQAEAETLRAAALKARAAQKDAEMRLASIEAKAAQVSKTMFSGTVTGARELENLQKEIDMLGRQKDDAEMLVLEAMEATGEASARADAAETALAALADTYRTVRAAYKERHAQLSAEIAADEQERTAAAQAVPPTLLSRYDAIRTKKGGIGAAPLDAEGTGCGACHTRLNSTLLADVNAAHSVQVCEYCGRILVPPQVV